MSYSYASLTGPQGSSDEPYEEGFRVDGTRGSFSCRDGRPSRLPQSPVAAFTLSFPGHPVSRGQNVSEGRGDHVAQIHSGYLVEPWSWCRPGHGNRLQCL